MLSADSCSAKIQSRVQREMGPENIQILVQHRRQSATPPTIFLLIVLEGPVSSTSLGLSQMYSFKWLSNTPLCICSKAFLSIHLPMVI